MAGLVLSLGIARLRSPAPPQLRVPHRFGVSDPSFVPSALAGSLMTEGNRIEVLENGDRIFPAMLGRRSDRCWPAACIFEYRGTMFHPKLMIVDGRFSTVGSANFDDRSFRLNEELNLVSDDPGIAAVLEASFGRDLARSRPYTEAEWRAKPLGQRIAEWALRPFRSQL